MTRTEALRILLEDAERVIRKKQERQTAHEVEVEYREVGRAPNVYTLYSTLPNTSSVSKPKNTEKPDLTVKPVSVEDRNLKNCEQWIWARAFFSKYPHYEFVTAHTSNTVKATQYIFLDTNRNIRVVFTEEQILEKIHYKL